MSFIITLLIFFLTIAGCIALNDNGSYTQSLKGKVLGFTANFIALILAMWLFGSLRGLFVYVGIVSLIGMLYPLINYSKNTLQR